MRVVWLDGALVEPGTAALSIDDPGVRWGEGLFETMRAEGGGVPLLGRHLDRLARSARVLGLSSMPAPRAMEEGVEAVVAALGRGPGRVRLTATPRPTLLVEGAFVEPLDADPPAVRALAVRGAWQPGLTTAEHKTLSYAGFRRAQRQAVSAGAQHALLLDGAGRLGEAATTSVFCVVDGRPTTAPAMGLLPGIARALVLEGLTVAEEVCDESAWRSAGEIVLTNALRGAMAVVEVDGVPVGDGSPGPVAHRIHALLREELSSPRRGASASG